MPPKRICKHCKVEKDYTPIKSEIKPTRYADEHGKRWNGALCFTCSKENQRKRALLKKLPI